jgi:hypothetical protein
MEAGSVIVHGLEDVYLAREVIIAQLFSKGQSIEMKENR